MEIGTAGKQRNLLASHCGKERMKWNPLNPSSPHPPKPYLFNGLGVF